MADLLLTLAPQLPMVVLLAAIGMLIGKWVNAHINKLMQLHQEDKIKNHEERTKEQERAFNMVAEMQRHSAQQADKHAEVIKENTQAYGGVTALLGRLEGKLDGKN